MSPIHFVPMLSIACFCFAIGSSRPERISSRPVVPPAGVNDERASNIHFECILHRVETLNKYDLDYFAANWPDVRKELQLHANRGGFKSLPRPQQEKLWWSLSYLRGCKHPRILHKHGDEILPILFALDVPEHNKQLREILQSNE